MRAQAQPSVRQSPPPTPIWTDLPPDRPVAELSDAEVMSSIGDGSSEALAELYDRYAGVLLATIRRMVSQVDDADEILQEVFLHVWNRASTYDASRSSVSTWLFLIARSRSIDRLRSRQTVDRTLAGVRRENRGLHAAPRGTQEVLTGQRRERLTRAMRNLPDEQRAVLVMAFYEGLSHSQIARRAGIPIGTVKTRSVLGMKKLRRALSHQVRELL